MQEKIRIGVITFLLTIVGIIFFLNINRSLSFKTYDFERDFSRNSLFSIDSIYKNMGKDNYLMFTDSDTLIAESEKEIDNINSDYEEYNFYFQDKNFKNKKTLKIKLPKGSNRLLSNLSEIYYTNKFKLYKYDANNKKSKIIDINNFKAISLRTIGFSKSKLLIFGEQKVGNKFITGFYIYDNLKNKLKLTKGLVYSNVTDVPVKTLEYSGNFTTSIDRTLILYYCDKFSEMYLFNSNGSYLKTIKTSDNTPLPKITTNSNGINFYTRGSTWNTNMGVVIANNNLLVFSASNNEKFKIIIDKYQISNGKYLKSYYLDNSGHNSKDIRNAFIQDDKLILVFEFNYASFFFSRYK